jgi:hypothetical protein
MSRKRKPPKQTAGPPPDGQRRGKKQSARTAAAMGMFAVDRKEGDVVVVVDEDGRVTDVPSVRLPAQARREGAVLRVPLDSAGMPSWEDAVRDRGEERRRRAMMAARIERLKRTDPGGDIEL